ncbi:MAG: Gfo/Idh/MocA family oxidoreductase [Pseudomonadota bacterium]
MVRIGLLGASRISVGAIIEPARAFDDAVVHAVAARDPARARVFAEQHGIPRVCDDYASLVESPDIDLVYNGLPPAGHKHWTILALQAGKSVLCEKPFAMNATEAAAMVQAARDSGNRLIEAFHYRFHPFFERVLEIVQSGDLGDIVEAHAHFNVPIPYTPTELRYQPELGGGALMDLGVYPLHWLRTLFSQNPSVSRAHSEISEAGVDVTSHGVLTFQDGLAATFSTSMDTSLPDKLDAGIRVRGSKAEMHVHNPLAPHIGNRLTVSGASEPWSFAGESTYFYQLQHTLAVLRGDAEPITGGQDSIDTLRLVDDVKRVAQIA